MNLNRSIRRLRGEDGFALAGAATMIFILALVAVSVSLLVVIDARSAQRSAAQTELRGDTDAAVSNVIGQLTTRPGSVALAGLTGKWWDSTSTSQRATCPASKDKASCYKATVVSSNAPNGADPTAGTAITLDVDSVSQCGTDAIGAPVDRLGKGGCQSHVTRVVMSRRSFLDYVIHADREALPPEAFTTYAKTLGASPDCTGLYGTRSSACDVAYTSNDNITGPVHSDDVGLLICGTPTFSTVDVVGTRSASPGTGWITDPTCSTTSGVTGTFHTATNGVGALAVADVLTQSCTTGGTGSCYYSDTIKSLAQTSGTALRAGAAIRFDSSGSPTISGTDLTSGSAVSKTTMPDTGVVYIDGDVTVGGTTANSTGKVKGQLTIFAAGKISIDSDLIYDGATATSAPSSSTTRPSGRTAQHRTAPSKQRWRQ
jgi:hypothetical protein